MIADNISRMFATSNLKKFSDAFQKLKEAAFSIKGEGIIAVLKGMMARPSRLSVMESWKMPCLWILGSMDNYINCEQIQPKVKLPANAKVVILKNSGHMGFIEEEEKSVKVITEFVRKCT
jgi:pimeloyl-ACP methyl ester carboxylesterase